MKHTSLFISLALLGGLIWPACAVQPTATPLAAVTSIPSPTPAASPTVPPSPTQIPTGTPTATPTYSPTPTARSTATPTATPTPIPTEIPTALPAATATEPAPVEEVAPPPASRTVRVGLHGRNAETFEELDYQVIQQANIETLKMMSFTRPEVFARLKAENPNLEFVVRLYDPRINADGHPTPAEFVAHVGPLMAGLQPYATKFEVGNEPNHFKGYEGWGPAEADAASFNDWFLEVYRLLKEIHPWAELGFPALGTPDSVHHHKVWLELNRKAIAQADWVGVHCYWQTYPDGRSTMFDDERGLCFKFYHQQFPDKALELTEFDNDNVIWEIPPLSDDALAAEYVAYYRELFNYPYLGSASSFILSSPDRQWDYFAWRTEDGWIKPVVEQVGQMDRPPLVE